GTSAVSESSREEDRSPAPESIRQVLTCSPPLVWPVRLAPRTHGPAYSLRPARRQPRAPLQRPAYAAPTKRIPDRNRPAVPGRPRFADSYPNRYPWAPRPRRIRRAARQTTRPYADSTQPSSPRKTCPVAPQAPYTYSSRDDQQQPDARASPRARPARTTRGSRRSLSTIPHSRAPQRRCHAAPRYRARADGSHYRSRGGTLGRGIHQTQQPLPAS